MLFFRSMQYRTMPRDDKKLSIIGFGVMRLPQKSGRIDIKHSEKLLLNAADKGVNYFDTAYPYIKGQSEPFLGNFLKKNNLRNSVYIATKLPHWQTKNTREMEKILENQLRRLKTDHIDYYLVHNLNGGSWQTVKQRGVLNFLEKAKKEGKIIKAGFSWHGNPEDFITAVDDWNWDFTQIQYNILDEKRQAGRDGLKYAASKGLGVVIMEPLRGGKLTTKIPPEAAEIWKEHSEYSPAIHSLRWIWNQKEAQVVLSGFSSEEHLEETLNAASEAVPGMLSAEESDFIERVKIAYKSAQTIDCTGCRYCVPCPYGVSIPEVFDWYNEYKTLNHTQSQKMFYVITVGGTLSGKSGLARNCVSCNVCLKKCPQSLPIPDLMKKISKEYEGFVGRNFDKAGTFLHNLKNRSIKIDKENKNTGN